MRDTYVYVCEGEVSREKKKKKVRSEYTEKSSKPWPQLET